MANTRGSWFRRGRIIYYMATKQQHVDLGFVEKVEESWKLYSHLFPSKVGGKPAWLSLHPLPSTDELKCKNCGEPCTFLAQLYSPVASNPESFHRTFFIFICRKPQCCVRNENKNIRVFRSNLPRVNKFYSPETPDYDNFSAAIEYPQAGKYQDLCSVCGCAGDKRCGKCRKVTYCCKDHQVADWHCKHKQCCGKTDSGDDAGLFSEGLLFKESEIVIEEVSEDDCVDGDDDDEEDDSSSGDEKKQMKEFKKQQKLSKKSKYSAAELESMASDKCDKSFNRFKKIIDFDPDDDDDDDDDDDEDDSSSGDEKKQMKEFKKQQKLSKKSKYSAAELESMASDKCDKSFNRFKKIIDFDPEQVVRYSRGGEPLWITDDCIPAPDVIPNCSCGAPRQFEFQIMPQLVPHVIDEKPEGSIDWGVLVVFSCRDDCDTQGKYSEEFIWKQDLLPSKDNSFKKQK